MQWLKILFRRRRYDELSASIREHLEERVAELMEDGMPRREAEQTARREFGNVTQIEERSREVWQWPRLESIWADVRFALRQMRRSPGFAITVALILALGIGMNAAIFSIVSHILLEPLPFPHPEQLQAVWAQSDALANPRIAASGPDFVDYHDQSRSFSKTAAFLWFTETWTGDGDPRILRCAGISEDFFSMLQIRPYMGRFYTTQEFADLHSPTVLVSYRFWKSQLGGDAHVVGRVIHVGGGTNTIVGVVPPLPDFLPDTDLWLTVTIRPSWEFMKWRNNKFLGVLGRLKPGVSPAAAEQELTAILRRAPGEPPDVRVRVTPLKDDLTGSVRTQLEMILTAVTLVLLVTCINVAALLLARASKRSGEMALRLSLGAGYRRLCQQLLVEGLVLTVLACVPGVVLAEMTLRLLPHLRGLHLPRLESVHLNGMALLATMGVAAATALVFGWAPSLTFSKLRLASSLREGRTDTGRSQHRVFNGLVVSEIATSLILAICAGLLLHSYWRVTRVDPGFEPEHVLTTYLRTNFYGTEGRGFWRDVLQGVAALPEVRAAAVADCTPGTQAAIATLVFSDRANDPGHAPPAEGCWTSADYFRVTGTALLRGRFFTAGDNAEAQPVVLINDEAARRFWPGVNPIGRQIGVNYTGPGRVGGVAPRMRVIVGVVQGIKQGPLDQPTEPAVYMPYLQDETHHDMASMSLFVRSTGNPVELESTIRARIHAIRADQPVDKMVPLEGVVAQSMAPRRYSLSLLGAFAALALLLSALGIYGIVSYTAMQRTREFGIRMAVGATRVDVMRLVLHQGLLLVVTGSCIGAGASLVLTRVLGKLLFEVSPLDPASFVSAVAVLAGIAIAACLLPALRAARVDLTRALHSE